MASKSTSGDPSTAALTAAQQSELRGLLLERRRALRAELSQGSEELGAARDQEAEEMDRAEITIELDDRAQRASRGSALLDEIEAALRRIEDGTFGKSEDSGEPIGYDRLKALPWARRTAREEEELEKER
jgi:DnaK suppressor protein